MQKMSLHAQRRLFVVMMFVWFVVFSGGTVFAQGFSIDGSELETFLVKTIEAQMEEHQIPNVAVAVVANGEIAALQGFGYADLDTRVPVTAETTMFRIGSSAKVFTWTAVMQLVEAGQLDLDTDVNAYLDFEIPSVLATTGETVAPITLKHLMTHTPGFEDYMSKVVLIDGSGHRPLAESIRENVPARVFPPGEVIAYSNYGTSLAGYIVERMTGVPFAQYIEENILQPLQMNYSTFRQPLPDALTPYLAKPYRFVGETFRPAAFEYMSEPGGSMSSSAGDMARFMLTLLGSGQWNGVRILEESSWEQMQTQLFTHHPLLHGMAHGLIEGEFNGYRVLMHPGGTMLYDTVMYLLPDLGVGFFMTHSGGTAMANLRVFQAFMDQYFPTFDSVVQNLSPGSVERNKSLVGEYHQNRRSFTTDDKMLSLMFGTAYVNVDEEGYLLLHHMGETHRFAEIEPGVYENVSEQRALDFSGHLRTIVFGTDPFGRTMLMMDGPVSYSRAPLSEQAMPTFVGLGLSVLIIVVSLLAWGIGSLVNVLRRRSPHSKEERFARGPAVIFAVLTTVMIVEFLLVGEPDPVYLLPSAAYNVIPAWSAVWNLVLPWLLAVASLLTLIATVLAWKNRYWKWKQRVHMTLFTGASLFLMAFLAHWNLWVW